MYLVIGLFITLFFIPFGGQIKSIVPPNPLCPFPVLIIGPPVPGAFAIIPSIRIYPYGALHPGAWVLGTFSPKIVCLYAVPIMMFGTSL